MMQTNFNGSEGEMISESQARAMIQEYLQGPCYGHNSNVVGHFFGREIINKILEDPRAQGIRIYYGSKPSSSGISNDPQLILVGTDENGDDILSNGKIADVSRPCPEFCPETTGLAMP